MEVIILASGSHGNSIYVEQGSTKLLIDAGLSGREIETRLQNCGKSMEGMTGVIVTHEHRDHASGVGVLSRRYELPVYATQGTWEGMGSIIGKIDPIHQHNLKKQGFQLEDFFIEPFPVSHDAREPVGLTLYGKGQDGQTKKLGLATDSGVFTPIMKQYLAGSHGLILESNHDMDMLAHSRYPYYLKQRIKSRKGHLSNHALAENLPNVLNSDLNHLVLGHLSDENNCPSLVHNTIDQVLKQNDDGCQLSYQVALRRGPEVMFEL